MRAARSPRSARSRNVAILATAMAAQVCTAFPMLLTAGLAVQIRDELAFTPARLGGAMSVFTLARVVGSFSLGRRADRVGAEPPMRLALAGSAVAATIVAVLARDWSTLVAGLFVGGFAQALSQPATSS
jgi:MFS family permease